MRKFISRLLVAGALTAPLLSSAFVVGPTTPGKWGPAAFGTGATVTYSFMATGTSCAAEFAGCTISHLSSFMPLGWEAAISSAFASWSSVADITFIEVADGGEAFNAAGASGDMRIGGHVFDGAGSPGGHEAIGHRGAGAHRSRAPLARGGRAKHEGRTQHWYCEGAG